MSDLTQELAKKALEADLRNALTEVAKGGMLPPAKRAALEETVAKDSGPDVIEQKRRARLLHIYITAAHRLTDSELIEIADLLPSSRQSERRVTKDRYEHALDHYSSIYGYAVRNLKKWLQIGREREPLDLPPLNEPQLMPAWWTRNMKQRVPPRLLTAAGQSKPEAKPESEKASTNSVPPKAAPEGVLKGTGYAAMIERATHAELVAWEAWQETLKAQPFNAAEEEMRRRAYDRACEQARKVLKDRDAGLAGDDEWGRWEEFETLAQEHISTLNQSLRSLPVRVVTKLALPPEMLRKVSDVWHQELDRIFDALDKLEWRAAPGEEQNFQLEDA